MPFLCRSGHPWSLSVSFWFVDPCFFPQEAVIDLLPIDGQGSLEVAPAEISAAGGLDGWVKALPLLWFFGLAILVNMVELAGRQGLLVAFILPWSK